MREVERTTWANLARALLLAAAVLVGVLWFGMGQSAAQQPPGGVRELVANGSFERDTIWQGSRDVEYSPEAAYVGRRALHFPAAADNFAYQTITMPLGLEAAALRFAWTVADADVPGSPPAADGDTLRAVFCPVDDERCRNDYGMTSVLTSTGGGWQIAELSISDVNLQRLSGQPVNLVFFKLQDDNAPAATFYVDDVSLLVATSSRTAAERSERVYLPLVRR